MSDKLNAERALIFRITHRDNVPWILDHGIHCGSTALRDPHYVTIGNPDLIVTRATRNIPIRPHGTLSDYVPFYFAPYSPMMLNIKTGYGGITKRANEEIVIMASSLPRLKQMAVPFVFSNKHAYLKTAAFYSNLADLTSIDWTILQNRDFKRDINDLEKVERYQAEALVFKNCPVAALLHIGCFSEGVRQTVESAIEERALELKVSVQRGWYF